MGDVVNLNKYRKERARLSKQRRAAENRSRAGQGAAERIEARKVEGNRDKEHDGKRLVPARPADEPPSAG
jgi:hypothetical protein